MRTALKENRVGLYETGKPHQVKRVGKKKSRISFFKVISVLIFFGAFILSSLFYTWAHMQVVHIGYEIAKVKTLESEFLEINKKLKTEIATLKTPLRIKHLARNKLGLYTPKKNQVIIIK
jgi:cell division protein FtsL